MAAVALLFWIRGAVTPFLFALVLAYLAGPGVAVLERRQVPRGAAILIVYLCFAMVAAVLVLGLLPGLVREIQEVARRFPPQRAPWEEATGDVLRDLQDVAFLRPFSAPLERLVQRVEEALERLGARVAGVLLAALGQVGNLALAPVLAFYMLKDRENLGRGLVCALPPPYRPTVLLWLREVDRALAGVVRGQIIISAVVGGLVAAGLAILGVRLALLLGLTAGLLNVIPYFGSLLGGLPAVAMALTQGPTTALWALGLLVAVNQLEASFVAPRVLSGTVGLHPLTVILVVLAGLHAAGIAGALVATPLAAVFKITYRIALESAWGSGPFERREKGPAEGSGP